jgi:ABC transporter with metal-binding/Fe-S-binding domain ATP-binding protein
MKVGVLFSGGKDSFYALLKAGKYEEPACLISVVSENKESYMFHTPGQNLLEAQADAIGLPLVTVRSKGEKELELADLEAAIKLAKKKFKIKGVVTGALASIYQATRVQKICNDLKLWCFNPLWQKDQIVLLHELVEDGFVVGINAVAAEPFDEHWLGVTITPEVIDELQLMAQKHHINPAGEGGEFETFVIDSPLHRKKLVFGEKRKVFKEGAGVLEFSFVRTMKK